MGKKTVGLVETVKISGEKTIKTKAVFDTGAKYTSIDTKLSKKAKLGPIIRTTKIKNPSLKGWVKRPVVKAIIEIKGQKFETNVNLQDRSHMTFPVIIGRNILSGNFIIDPEKNEKFFKKSV